MSEAFNKNMLGMREAIHPIRLLATSIKFWFVLLNAMRGEGEKEKAKDAHPGEVSGLPKGFHFSKAGFLCAAILL